MVSCASFRPAYIVAVSFCCLPHILAFPGSIKVGERVGDSYVGLSYRTVPRFQSFSQHIRKRDIQLSVGKSASNENDTKKTNSPKSKYDVVVVGSGIGGLSAAAMLAKYGCSVAVFESHYAAGGCAHGFRVKDSSGKGFYSFDTGPSFFSGLNPNLPPKASNPLRTVLDAVGETVDCIPYKTFGLLLPEGELIHTAGFGSPGGALDLTSGPQAVEEWSSLMRSMSPLSDAVAAMPTVALRADVGAALTAGRYLPNFATINPFSTAQLTRPFSDIVQKAGVKDKFAKNWLDLLCFCLSGLKADGTITAEMAMMMEEFYDKDATMDCPRGGAKGIVDALVRGIEKYGGSVFVNSHVESIDVKENRATGVQVRRGKQEFVVKARQGVISNLSVWDLFGKDGANGGGLVDQSKFPSDFLRERLSTPPGKSFMHLHVGFKASKEELSKLQAHYVCMEDWSRGIEAEDNAALISIPSVHDSSLAPPGHAVLHAYTPATESFGRWDGVDTTSSLYQKMKEERSAFLWKTLRKVLPDIEERTRVAQVGTPLTHRRFLRRYKGSYGPAILAGGPMSFPFPNTPVKGLLCCGDSCFPGIGVPAVAGSGIIAANSVSFGSLGPQLKLLEQLEKIMK